MYMYLITYMLNSCLWAVALKPQIVDPVLDGHFDTSIITNSGGPRQRF